MSETPKRSIGIGAIAAFTVGVVGGAVAGALTALAFAPKSGQQMREDISDWLKERREKSRALLSKVKETVQETVNETVPQKKEQILAAAKAAKTAYHEAGKKQDLEREPLGV